MVLCCLVGLVGWLVGWCVVVCVCFLVRPSLFLRPAGAYLDFYDLAERLLGWWAVTPGGGGGCGCGCGGGGGGGRFGW